MADGVGQGDIKYYWKSGLVQMPSIEKLGAMGDTFYDAHSTPLCAPLRCMLFSGNYAHRGQIPAGRWRHSLTSTWQMDRLTLPFRMLHLGQSTLYSPPYTYLDGTKITGTCKMDKVVGSLASIIDERDLAEDVIRIFTSDNGGAGGNVSSQHGHNSHGPFRAAKGDIYDGCTKVSMILRCKGNFPGANETRWNLVELQDLYATICELAGVDIPDRSARDSMSFAENMYDGKAPSPRKWQF